MRGRNKLVPRLLGITRESIMRVDETTKEVLKTWPLTTVRRWAASPNSFTLVSGVCVCSYILASVTTFTIPVHFRAAVHVMYMGLV